MTTVQVLGLSASLLVNALLIVWCMYHARRITDIERDTDDATRMAVDAVQRAIIAQRLAANKEVRP